jgi:urease gamma subunit
MDLTPREKDKLLIFTAALLAERRKARGSAPPSWKARATARPWLN